MLVKDRDDHVDDANVIKLYAFADFVTNQIDRIAHLVEDILDFGRIRTGSYKLERHNICEVIREVINETKS
jgi:signal transduction histidine kinase